MSVSVCGQFTNFDDPLNGYVLVSLIGPVDYDGLFFDNRKNVHFAKDHIWRADIGADGSWCIEDLPTNDNISPMSAQGDPLTFYKVNFVLNGKHAAVDSFILNRDLPDQVQLTDISFNVIACRSTDHLCSFVENCESVWMGIGGNGIDITDDSLSRAGHQPEISVDLSGDAWNQLSFGEDDGLYYSWDCTFLDSCEITDLANVVCRAPNVGDVLKYDGENWSCGRAEFSSLELCDLSDVADICPDSCAMLAWRDDVWTPVKPFDNSSFDIDKFCNITVSISGDECNLVNMRNDGLHVSPPEITGALTHCIDTDVTGKGCDGDPFVVFAKPILSPDPDNCLRCTDLGMKVAQVHSFDIVAPDIMCEVGGGFVPAQNFHYAVLADETIFAAHLGLADSPFGGDLVVHIFDGTDEQVLAVVNIKAGSLQADVDKEMRLPKGHLLGLRVESGPQEDKECAAKFLSGQFYYTMDCVI